METAPGDDFATRLRQLMVERSITQIDLSGIAGVTQSAVSRWLDGMQPNKQRVRRIAIHCDLNEEWLLTGQGAKDLTLAKRRERDEAKVKQAEEAQAHIEKVEGAKRVIYIQDRPDRPDHPLRKLRFDSVTDEQWAILTKMIEEEWKKTEGNKLGRENPVDAGGRVEGEFGG